MFPERNRVVEVPQRAEGQPVGLRDARGAGPVLGHRAAVEGDHDEFPFLGDLPVIVVSVEPIVQAIEARCGCGAQASLQLGDRIAAGIPARGRRDEKEGGGCARYLHVVADRCRSMCWL